MVSWDEAGKTWPQPHPHAARLLRGLLWGQHYRHSNPQCEGSMPGSFELRENMGGDRLRAVEEWLRAEGYAYRFLRKRWRVWIRPDRPGEGLRPDGIEEDENPNEYPSGAPINASMWDMIDKEFRSWGTRARCRAAAAAAVRLLARKSVAPGTGSGTGSGGSTRNPWPPKTPKAPGADPGPQPPTGQWWSPPRPHHPWRLPGSRQAGQGQAPSAAPKEVRPQQRRGVGPPREDAG